MKWWKILMIAKYIMDKFNEFAGTGSVSFSFDVSINGRELTADVNIHPKTPGLRKSF